MPQCACIAHEQREEIGNDLRRKTRETPCGAPEIIMLICYSDSLSRCYHVVGSKIAVNQSRTASGQASSPLGVIFPHGYPSPIQILGSFGVKNLYRISCFPASPCENFSLAMLGCGKVGSLETHPVPAAMPTAAGVAFQLGLDLGTK